MDYVDARKFSLILLATVMGIGTAKSVTWTEIEAYKPLATEGGIILNTGFDGKDDMKRFPNLNKPIYSIVGNGQGVMGTRALMISRTNPKEYTLGSIALPNLAPDLEYKVTVSYRTENIRGLGPKGMGIVALETSKNGKWRGGLYARNAKPSDTWTTVSFFGKPRGAQFDKAGLTLYMNPKITGKLFIDNVSVTIRNDSYAVLMTQPQHLTSWQGKGHFAFKADQRVPEGTIAAVSLKLGDRTLKKILKPVTHGCYAWDAGQLTPGPATIDILLADPRKKAIIGAETYRLTVRKPEARPKNAAVLDEHHRLIVEGKPFFPLGIFINHSYEKALRQISETDFNFILAYAINRHDFLLDRKNITGDYGRDVKTFLDLAHSYGLRVVPSLIGQTSFFEKAPDTREVWGEAKGRDAVTEKFVKTFKDHPAMLGYYVSDEAIKSNVKKIQHLREIISRNDPFHPTITLTYEWNNLPYYAISGDIFLYDSYPISYKKGPQSIKKMLPGMKASLATGIPFWMAPQIFNWGIYKINYRDKAAWENSHFPTADEIMAQPLLCAINGAKGYVFYMYDCTVPYAESRSPGCSPKEWKKVADMAATMKGLAPFLLSLNPAPQVTVTSSVPGEIQARAFDDGQGNLRVLVVSLGQACKGEIAIRDGRKLSSRTGRCVQTAPNTFSFAPKAISWDILQTEK